MRNIFIILLMSVTHVKFNALCPVRSCVVCSENVIICRKLSSVIVVPETIEALMLTDGLITSVDNSTLSGLSSMTVLGLSNNIISNIMENAFHHLTVLRMLLMDHNHIASASIPDSAFIQLQNLEILQLGHNVLENIKSCWFRGTSSLLTLQLEGNLITRLPPGTFSSANLDKLENLDLSDNLIEFLDRGSFHGLPRLRRLDLSRNSLRSAPDAFSCLSWLSVLNLHLNPWECTCELGELASFLNTFEHSLHQELHSSHQLACVSTANPAVQTVPQLTELNCVPPKKTLAMLVRSSVSPDSQSYARDISLTACSFFVGGAVLTAVIHYIVHKKLWPNGNSALWKGRGFCEEEGISRGAIMQSEGTPWCNFTKDSNVEILTITHPGREAKLMQPNQEQRLGLGPWTGEMSLPNGRPARPEQRVPCPDGSPQARMYNSVRTEDGRSYGRRAGEGSTLGSIAMREESRRQEVQPRLGPYQNFQVQNQYQGSNVMHHMLNNQRVHRDIIHKVPQLSANQKDSPTMNPWTTERIANGGYRALGDSAVISKAQSESGLPDCLTVNCMQCQRACEYRLAVIQGKNGTEESHTNNTEHMYITERLSRLKTKLYRESSFKSIHGEHQLRKLGIHAQQKRNVTFNLTEQELHFAVAPKKMKTYDTVESDGENTWNEESKKQKRWDRKNQRNLKHGLLKVKINLNPLKKSRIHPKYKMDFPPQQNGERNVKGRRARKGNKETADVSERRGQLESKGSKTKEKKTQTADEDTLSEAQHAEKSHQRTAQEIISPRLKNKLTQLHDAVLETIKECVDSQLQGTENVQTKDTTKDSDKEEHKIIPEDNTKECQTDFEKEEERQALGVSSGPEDLNKKQPSEDSSQNVSTGEDTLNEPAGESSELVKVSGEGGAETEQPGDLQNQTSESPSQEGNPDTATNQETEDVKPPDNAEPTPPAQSPSNTPNTPSSTDPASTQSAKKQKQAPSKPASSKKKPQSAAQKKAR